MPPSWLCCLQYAGNTNQEQVFFWSRIGQKIFSVHLKGRGLSAIANLKIQERIVCGEVLLQVGARKAPALAWNQVWKGLVVFNQLQQGLEEHLIWVGFSACQVRLLCELAHFLQGPRPGAKRCNSAAPPANTSGVRRCREMLTFNWRNLQWVSITFSI